MFIRFSMVASLAALVACGTAFAAPVSVQLRVEGATATIFEGPVTTDGKVITKDGNTLACDGTTGVGNPGPGPTITSALDDGSIANGFSWEATYFNDFFVKSIAGEPNTDTKFWGYALSFVPVEVGGCQQQVHVGDEVLFALDFFGPDFGPRMLLKLVGPTTSAVGESVNVTVVNGSSNAPVGGAVVGGKVTRDDGKARLSFQTPGVKLIKASRAGAIRSNALLVCVSPMGGGDCGVPATQLGRLGSGQGDNDAKAPTARISSPRSGARYRRGPRLLRGMASDDGSGVSAVKLSLRRYVSLNCSRWSGRRERFVGKRCGKASFFDAGAGPRWSYLMPRRLPPGRYVLDVKAVDRAGNSGERFVRGQSRVVFKVLGPAR